MTKLSTASYSSFSRLTKKLRLFMSNRKVTNGSNKTRQSLNNNKEEFNGSRSKEQTYI